jgi:Trypsin-like peptidase domain
LPPLESLLEQCTVKICVPGGWGTGFFVAPGLILTCAHVVRQVADGRLTVEYPAQGLSLAATVRASVHEGKTLDLALIELSEPLLEHPCVLLGEEPVAIGQALYSYGYLQSYANAAPVHLVNEGLTGDKPPLLKLKDAQIEPGISGAALLNLQTGKVCGMVKETRAAGFDLGGGAIPTGVILAQFPELRELQRAFHESDKRWAQCFTDRTSISKPSVAESDFQAYLNSVAKTYKKWWQLYTLTDAEGRQRQKQEQEPAPLFDFGLMVQTVQNQAREQEKIERLSVLDGLRKYALEEQ